MLMGWPNCRSNPKSIAGKPDCDFMSYNGKCRFNNALNAAGFTGLAR